MTTRTACSGCLTWQERGHHRLDCQIAQNNRQSAYEALEEGWRQGRFFRTTHNCPWCCQARYLLSPSGVPSLPPPGEHAQGCPNAQNTLWQPGHVFQALERYGVESLLLPVARLRLITSTTDAHRASAEEPDKQLVAAMEQRKQHARWRSQG